MGSESCKDQAENHQAMPTKPPETKPETKEEEKQKPLGPITPDSDRENGVDVNYDSPHSSVKKTPSPSEEEEEEEVSVKTTTTVSPSPHTPKEGVFDPFAPGPEAKALAPLCRNYTSKARNVVARRLSFELSDEDEIIPASMVVSDEEIVEAVYESLLETIVAKQTEIALLLAGAGSSSGECFTPPPSSTARLSGLAETCPGAPARPGAKSRKIDPALCRRLQFSP